jgi:hypothetical protein
MKDFDVFDRCVVLTGGLLTGADDVLVGQSLGFELGLVFDIGYELRRL